MTDNGKGPRKDGPIGQFNDAAREARAGGAFGLLVFFLLGVAPVLGFGYIVIRFVLGLAGVELPELQTSAQ